MSPTTAWAGEKVLSVLAAAAATSTPAHPKRDWDLRDIGIPPWEVREGGVPPLGRSGGRTAGGPAGRGACSDQPVVAAVTALTPVAPPGTSPQSVHLPAL
nr:hypothetical protein KitaXyl93_08880 [Kitasatospora sp. Xyl93]